MVRTQNNRDMVTTFTMVNDNRRFALINYIEIFEWYNLPFYKKWFIKKPIKELIEVKQ